MTVNTLKDKLASKKFIFSVLALGIVSVMLYVEKLPPNYYEVISTTIIISYLSSNVAYKYVSGKGQSSQGRVEEIEQEAIYENEQTIKEAAGHKKEKGIQYGE